MQSTKYATGLFASGGSGSSLMALPSNPASWRRSFASRNLSSSPVASKLPLGPKTCTRSMLYGQSHDAWRIAVASKVHDRAAAVFLRIVEPVRKRLRYAYFFGPGVAVLHDDLLYRAHISRSRVLLHGRGRWHPCIPVIHEQLDAGLIRETKHFTSISGSGRHRLFGREVDVTPGTFAQDFQMTIV